MNLLEQFVLFLVSKKNKPSLLTIKNYKADVGQFINWFENEFKSPLNPSAITLQILEQYKKTRNLSPSSIQRHLSSLRKFFIFLKTRGIISYDLLEKRTVSAQAQAEADPWMLRNFKSFLYESKKSNLTIKNYINDIKSFFAWLEKAALTKYTWVVTERHLLSKINYSTAEEYKQRLITAKFSPLTINRKLSSLRSYIAWAESQGFIPENSEYSENQNIRLSDNQIVGSSDSPSFPSIPNENSSFPPVRLMQKSLKGINLLFDTFFILPIAQSLESAQYLLWKATGKKVFTKSNLMTKSPLVIPVSNIQKEFYAPLTTSTRYLPVSKRVWHRIRHVRPQWYKQYHSYSFTHYIHFAVLMIFSCIVGFGIYNGLIAGAQQQKNAILGAVSSAPPRILSFQGKLTDSQSQPITASTNILFSMYDLETATVALWQETDSITPDSEGRFSIMLGKSTPIPDTLFSENSLLFLGIKVGSSQELSPRQQLTTVPFASNSETLQGMEPITNTTKVSNVVLALDSSGNLSIAGSKGHTFQTIGGQFVLSGSILSLTTIPGSNSRVEIVPDGMGKIDLSKPIQNSSNNNNLSAAAGSVEFDDTVAILATSSAQSALYINQNSTGPLISASTSGTAKFTLENDGAGKFSGDLQVNGGDLTSTATTFNLLNSTVTTLNLGGAATNLVLGATTGTIVIRNGSAAIQGNVSLGDAVTDILTFTGRVGEDSDLIPIGTSGTNDLGSSSLPWDNAYINNIYAVKLDVQDSQSATAAAQIFNTNSGTDADGLVLKLGNTSTSAVASSNHFLSFETSGIGIIGSVQGNGGTGITYATSGVADFAEYLKKEKAQTIEYGSVVCLDNNGLAVKCDNSAKNIVGVASERPAFLGGEDLGNGSIAVGLIGQIETLISIVNGAIKPGDLLTASDIPGVAVKSTTTGQVVGRALENVENIDELKIVGYYDPDSKEYRSKDNFPNIPIKPNIIKIVKIYALISVSWHDSNAYLASSGELIINKNSNGYSIASPSNETLTNTQGFFEIVAANIRGGLIKASEIVTNSLVVTADTIIVNGQNLKDYILSVVGEQTAIISPIVRTEQLAANIISPLGESLIVRLATPSAEIKNPEFIIQNSSGSAVATINSDGDASFSGQLTSNSLTTNQVRSQELAVSSDASISGTLRAKSIVADSISGFIDIASFSAELTYVPNLQAEQGLFNQGLMVFGGTSLSDLSIAGNLSIGGTMFITENSIETLGTDLSLQSLKQGGVSIMGGLVYIDTNGNLKTQGDVAISGKLAVNIISPLPTSDLVINNASGSGVLSISKTGDITASGSGTFAKLNFSLVQPVLALSPTEAIASSSAGVANITPYQSELTIKNALVTDKSVIYITPVGTPSAQTPFLMRQIPNGPALSGTEGSFTVGVESPTNHPLNFNWLIIN